jgi:transglutaminase-like putative cysteine protease
MCQKKIYNWAYNNIQFIPTYGSIQSSQLTLETKSGNATDTASLLIALLRASGIHARYAYGTVRIPIEKVMNWVGGVTAPAAAIQIFGQSGIPTAGLAQGGKIAFVKMEHVWVEAWVDYRPSRGARHKKGDSWIPMDASFKQYQFTEGMDIQSNVPFDAENFVEQLTQNAQINETEGWVSGIDQTFMETTLQNYQTQMETYITQTNPDATVGEVLGTQTIIPSNRPTLAAGLPYSLMAKGNTFKELPSNLRHHFKFSLYKTEMDRILDEPALNLSHSLPELAGKRLTLSFEPATDSDRQVIESYLPEIPEGQQLDLNDLPTSLPGYLINLNAQLKLDGEIVAESGSFTMGQELSSTTGITRLTGGWHSANNKPIAGEFYAFGIDLAGISAKQLETVKTRMETVKTKLENQQFEGLTKDGLVGDMLYAGALSYFAALDVNLKMLNKGKQALAYRQPSCGTFSTSLNTVYSFGVPRQVEMSGIMVDMDAVAQSLWSKNNDVQIANTIGQQVGMMTSALEHRIPEMLFTNEENPGEAVSAVKALAIASSEGQRIYQVTTENVNAVLPVLNISADVKNEIRASVAVGKVATVSQNNITVGSWTGVGYIIADPQTGAGAYRISGGSNGGSFDKETLLSYGMAILSVIFGVGGIWVFAVIGGGLAVLLAALFFVSLFASVFSEANPCTGFDWGILALAYDFGMSVPIFSKAIAALLKEGLQQLRIVAIFTLLISSMGYFNPQSPPSDNCPK